MRAKRNGYGVQESYAGYGLERNRAKDLLKECRAGKYNDLLWIVESITEGKSFDRMAVKWELGEAEIMPCCRNSFYAYRKLTLAILDRMLRGKDAV